MRTSNLRFLHIFLVIFFILPILVSCEKKQKETDLKTKKITIITTLFPVYDFTREIVKDKANITMLLSPGVEPHSFNPRPTDIAELHKADILIYTNIYMEPWIDDIIKGVSNQKLLIIDSSKGVNFLKEKSHTHERGHIHITKDPHVWLDFSNAILMIDNILEGLIKKDPFNADFYKNNALQYKTRLSELDERFKKNLMNCQKNVVVSGGHLSFQYLSKRYNLKYISAYESLSPDAEPTPRQLKKIIKTIKTHDLKHIFYEELITPRIAETISKETGAQLLMLHAAHNISRDDLASGQTFLSIMERNLTNLKTALQCQ